MEATAIKLVVRPVQPVSQLRISLQDTSFELGAFAEPWELEADAADEQARIRSSGLGRPGRLGVERKGNVTKVPFWAHVGDLAMTTLQVSREEISATRTMLTRKSQFDLDVDFMYQAGEPQAESASESAPVGSPNEEDSSTTWKTFSFRVRVNLGDIQKQERDM